MIIESLKDIYFSYFAGTVHHIHIKKEAKRVFRRKSLIRTNKTNQVLCVIVIVVHTSENFLKISF